MIETREYGVGDAVWVASYGTKCVRKPCIVCHGSKQVTLILGNDDRVLLPCDYCGHGFKEPSGFIEVYECVAEPEAFLITRVLTEDTSEGQVRRYYSGSRYVEEAEIYDSREEAAARAAERAYEETLAAEEQAHRIKKRVHKSFAWNAGYHLKAAVEARRQVAHHEKMAVLCKARARGSETGT